MDILRRLILKMKSNTASDWPDDKKLPMNKFEAPPPKERAILEGVLARVRRESRFRSHGKEKPRLVDFFNAACAAEAGERVDITNVHIVVLSEDGIRYATLENQQNPAIPDIFIVKGSDGNFHAADIKMAFVCARLIGKEFESDAIACFEPMAIEYDRNVIVSIRATAYVSQLHGDKKAPIFYLTYDTNPSGSDVRNDIVGYSRARVDMLMRALNGKQLSDEELEILGESNLSLKISDEILYGRVGELLFDLPRLHHSMLDNRNVNGSTRLLMREGAMMIADSMCGQRLWSTAMYYYNLAKDIETAIDSSYSFDVNDKIDACRAKMGLPVGGADFDNAMAVTRFGLVLGMLFKVGACQLKDMIVLPSDPEIHTLLIKDEDLWDFNPIEVYNAIGEYSAFLRIEGRHDKMLTFHCQGDEDEMRAYVTFVLPGTFDSADIDASNTFTLAYPICDIITPDDFHEHVQGIAAKAVDDEEEMESIERLLIGRTEEAHMHFFGALLSNHLECKGEALYHLAKAIETLRRHQRTLDCYDKELVPEVFFKMGALLNELHVHDSANSYLNQAMQSVDVRYRSEYINSLCDAHDMRAGMLLRAELKCQELAAAAGDDENFIGIGFDEEYYSFLQRRLSRVLAEEGKMVAAKNALAALAAHPDPANRAFAIEELKRIIKEGA